MADGYPSTRALAQSSFLHDWLAAVGADVIRMQQLYDAAFAADVQHAREMIDALGKLAPDLPLALLPAQLAPHLVVSTFELDLRARVSKASSRGSALSILPLNLAYETRYSQARKSACSIQIIVQRTPVPEKNRGH